MESIANKHPHLSSFQLRLFKHANSFTRFNTLKFAKLTKTTGLGWSLNCRMMQILSFPIFQLQEMNLEVVVNGVRYLLDRCGFVPAMLFVIVMSSFHHAQCMKQKISFTNWYNPEGGLYSKHAEWCNNYVSKIMKGFTKKNQIKEIMKYLSNKVKDEGCLMFIWKKRIFQSTLPQCLNSA